MENASWENIEYFSEKWKERIKTMADMICESASEELTIVDFGCGKMWLKEFVPLNIKYIGVDYIRRDEKTIVADFNKYEFPRVSADIAFISGCLEYVDDPKWFLCEISTICKTIMLSYCTTDFFPDLSFRTQRRWKNHLSYNDIMQIVGRSGFVLVEEKLSMMNNQLFKFNKPI